MKLQKLIQLLPLLSVCLLISCGQKKEEKVQEEEKIKVRTATARSQEVDKLSTYTATVKADVINQITPSAPGRVERILVDVSDRVSKGQLLVKMEAYSLEQQTTQLNNLKKDYERYNELLKVGGIAQQQVDQLQTQIEVLESAISNLEKNTELRSPISGVITARNYDNGDVYSGTPILTVQQLSPLKAIVNVSESNFKDVHTGMPVDIRLDVYEEEVFTGKVTMVYPTIDPTTHTFGVEVTIHNPDMRVRPGMYARVTLNFGSNSSVLVPDMAVQKQSGSNDRYVYTVSNGRAKYNKVEVGQRLGSNYEILSGIQPGEEVVTAGHTRLIDGIAVEIVKE
jgi:RND family efflux transporter, MFP subunit